MGIILVKNNKGGVGKTYITLQLAAYKALIKNKKTLILTSDSQNDILKFAGIKIEDTSKAGLEDFIEGKSYKIKKLRENLFFLHLQGYKIKNSFDEAFKKAIKLLKDEYDYILIDCAPSLGLITLNALTAANSVIVPIQCEYFALEGLGKLLNTIKSVQKTFNPDLDIEGLLLTMYDARLRLSNQVVEEVQKHFSDMVFKTIIQRNVRLSEAPSFGETIINYDATSKGATNHINLAQEIIDKNKTA